MASCHCAEVWSARKAILNGEKFDDLKYYSIEAEKGNYKEFCNNCSYTFAEHEYNDFVKDGFYE